MISMNKGIFIDVKVTDSTIAKIPFIIGNPPFRCIGNNSIERRTTGRHVHRKLRIEVRMNSDMSGGIPVTILIRHYRKMNQIRNIGIGRAMVIKPMSRILIA